MRNAITDRAHSKLLAAAIALTLLPGPTSAAVSAPELPNPGHVGMSRQQQIQLGFQSAAEVYKGMPVLPDNSPETQYVRQLGAKLVATIPQQYTWPYEFHVVAQKEINAFALPGGPMFVNIGTITAADNEAVLAGVKAHEMSHVYMQHSARQVGKAKKAGIFAGIAEIAAGTRAGRSRRRVGAGGNSIWRAKYDVEVLARGRSPGGCGRLCIELFHERVGVKRPIRFEANSSELLNTPRPSPAAAGERYGDNQRDNTPAH